MIKEINSINLFPKDYEHRTTHQRFVCFNCDTLGREIYVITDSKKYFEVPNEYRWLCSKCYDKLFKKKWKQDIETGKKLS